jgi:hypothetical protein
MPSDGRRRAWCAASVGGQLVYVRSQKSILGRGERLLIKIFTISVKRQSLSCPPASDLLRLYRLLLFPTGAYERSERLTLLFWQAICAKR